MDLCKNGKLLKDLRKSKGMTQKQVADKLGIMPKTVSKWETGHGFPDVSIISSLADIFGVSERMLLTGDVVKNPTSIGNIRRMKLYVCPHCGNVIQGIGECVVECCGKKIDSLKADPADENHCASISHIENDFYIEINHEMTKEHYISFIAYVGFDRVMMIKLYPEQDCAVRIPRIGRGKLYFFCNNHGLFEHKI